MIIQNFDKLARSSLRRQALKIAEAGLEAISTRRAFEKGFLYNARKDGLSILGKKYDLSNFRNVYCVAFGKAAFEGITAVSQILGQRLTSGFAIGLKQSDGLLAFARRPSSNIVFRTGSHPHPSEQNVEAAKELVEFVSKVKENDLVLCLVSGGGSALFCNPHSLNVETQAAVLKELMNGGADIFEMNCVRKHLSLVKGGQLAKIIYPAKLISMIFSDIPGDDLSAIASGPTVKDETTVADASAILNKYGILHKLNLPALKLSETPKEGRYFEKTENILFVSAKTALFAMKEKAEDLSYEVKIFDGKFQGIARELPKKIVPENQKPGCCYLGAGESTVVVLGSGIGGRNQEMALAASELLNPKQVFLAVASDGHDNSDFAGAIVDSQSQARARQLGMEPEAYLANNDSFNFFEALGDGLDTGLTGANVADFVILLNA